jgi:hypothetical protein
MDAVRLEADGSIDQSSLASELVSNLEFDQHYRQTDNMKKRAVKVAPSYDDFKAMVACAHLKKVTREEVESLSAPKKGWVRASTQRAVNASSLKGASILADELKHLDMQKAATSEKNIAIRTSSIHIPRTTLEFQRDIRRCTNMTEKVNFLSSMGLKQSKSLLKKDLDADFLEELLRILSSPEAIEVSKHLGDANRKDKENGIGSTEGIQENTDCTTVTTSANTSGSIFSKIEDEHSTSTSTSNTQTTTIETKIEIEIETNPQTSSSFDIFKWLKTLSKFGSFDLIIRFTDKDIIEKVSAILMKCDEVGREGAKELHEKYTQ